MILWSNIQNNFLERTRNHKLIGNKTIRYISKKRRIISEESSTKNG